MAQPAGRRLVQAGVLDGDGGLGGKELRQLLVLVCESPAAFLLGQVEVSVGDAAEKDRHAEEAAHRRMVRREAYGARIVAEVLQPQRVRLADENPEDAPASRQGGDRGVGFT